MKYLNKFNHQKIWEEGECLDLWSLNHIFAGASLAGLFFILKIPFLISFIISLILMLSWEIYEILNLIIEKPCNKIMDIVTGVLGFVITYYLFLQISQVYHIILFIVISAIFVFLELWGYFSYKKMI
jgi:hypothetical protein